MNIPPEFLDIHTFGKRRPKNDVELAEFRADWEKFPKEHVAAYNAWQMEQAYASPAYERTARVGYAAMQAWEPAVFPLAYGDLGPAEKRRYAEWVGEIKEFGYTEGFHLAVSRLKDKNDKAISPIFACAALGTDFL